MCKQEKNKYTSGTAPQKALISFPSQHFNSNPHVRVITQRETLLNSRGKYIAFCGDCICFCGNNKPYFSAGCGIPISQNKPAQFTDHELPITRIRCTASSLSDDTVREIRHNLIIRRRIDNCKKKTALRPK